MIVWPGGGTGLAAKLARRASANSKAKLRMRVVIALVVASCSGCSGSSEPPEGTSVVSFDYAHAVHRGSCSPGSKPAGAGATDGLTSRDGFHYNVRAPANLDPTYAHPLLVVYAPAGYDAKQSESLTRLTTEATRSGFVVVYVGSRPLSVKTIEKLAQLPKEVAAVWCVDPNRVYATGHSDGGTVSIALAVLEETTGTVSAIAPSAAGFSRKDLEAFRCPKPIPVMVMHGRQDTHFPGWGKEAALWWARCNACNIRRLPVSQDNGCLAFQGCAPNGTTIYCEGGGSHKDWPPLQNEILRFFESVSSLGMRQGTLQAGQLSEDIRRHGLTIRLLHESRCCL